MKTEIKLSTYKHNPETVEVLRSDADKSLYQLVCVDIFGSNTVVTLTDMELAQLAGILEAFKNKLV